MATGRWAGIGAFARVQRGPVAAGDRCDQPLDLDPGASVAERYATRLSDVPRQIRAQPRTLALDARG